MIVQSAPQGEPHFIVTMAEHCLLAGRFAKLFGNAYFEPVVPLNEMLYLINHHDRGWFELDAFPCVDPQTGLPWHLSNTPNALKVTTMMKSVNFNQAHHLYCGLLAVMHMWGIYHGRYGLSNNALIDTIPKEYKDEFNQQCILLEQRKTLLETQLKQDSITQAWLKRYLWQNYKQLQFFDTLSLYFSCTCASQRQPHIFAQVPMSATATQTVTIQPLDNHHYLMSPFPFKHKTVSLRFKGQYLQSAKRDKPELFQALKDAPLQEQIVNIVELKT
ncbi:DUF3891 family protein [uncultured Shewanella sp.]|uniref:DUF3891 family protein n=1 Tax=uncultured Shewanella sp. TaxID=173975 RepID=UPI002611100C|nr:DUF3891 family protein [uncultured Shewanella sp.]